MSHVTNVHSPEIIKISLVFLFVKYNKNGLHLSIDNQIQSADSLPVSAQRLAKRAIYQVGEFLNCLIRGTSNAGGPACRKNG